MTGWINFWLCVKFVALGEVHVHLQDNGITDPAKLSYLEKQAKLGDRMKALLASDYVGSFDGPEDLSVNYKQYVAEYLDEKYPQHTKVTE